MLYSAKRQKFLVDQGYAYKVIHDISDTVNKYSDLHFSDVAEQNELLATVMSAHEEEITADDVDLNDPQAEARAKRATAQRTTGSMSALSGGDDRTYAEYSTSAASRVVQRGRGGAAGAQRGKGQRHKMFKQWDARNEELRKEHSAASSAAQPR
jgi:DNA excision repair protein ERCC-3